MPMSEECTVIKTNGKYAVIEFVKRAECENCKACAFNRRNSIKMTAKNDTECKAGDTVIVEMPQKPIVGASVILFLIPLILIVVAVCITVGMEWFIQLIAVCIALLTGVGITIVSDIIIKRNPKRIPTVKKIVKEKNSNIGEAHD